jgi:cytochrome oxidase Cu insertion factor (SCO1/SenC/PrrC family)
MSEVQHRVRNLGDYFKIVSFSINPGKDTPARLRDYVRGKRISPRMWIFLTSLGDEAALRRTVNALFYPVAETVPEGKQRAGLLLDSIRTNKVVLVDGMLRIRGRYDIRDPGEIDRLLQEAGLVVNRPQYGDTIKSPSQPD